jgi:hypothetical protein
VNDRVAVAGTNDGDIIDAGSDVGKEVRDFGPALAVPAERAPAAEELGVAGDELIFRLAELGRPALAVELVQERFGVERFQVAGTAGHEEEDDGPRLRLEVRPLRHLWRCTPSFLVQHGSQPHGAEADESIAEKLTAGTAAKRMEHGDPAGGANSASFPRSYRRQPGFTIG